MWMPARRRCRRRAPLAARPARARRPARSTTARSHVASAELRRRHADPVGTELARELAVLLTASHDHHLALPVLQHLEREVCRRAEPEERDALARLHLGAPQRAVPDHARAQQRRGRRDRRAPPAAAPRSPLGPRSCVGVSAVDGPPGELGRDAQVLLATPAELADAARPVQPRDADPVTEREALGTRARASSTRPTTW